MHIAARTYRCCAALACARLAVQPWQPV